MMRSSWLKIFFFLLALMLLNAYVKVTFMPLFACYMLVIFFCSYLSKNLGNISDYLSGINIYYCGGMGVFLSPDAMKKVVDNYVEGVISSFLGSPMNEIPYMEASAGEVYFYSILCGLALYSMYLHALDWVESTNYSKCGFVYKANLGFAMLVLPFILLAPLLFYSFKYVLLRPLSDPWFPMMCCLFVIMAVFCYFCFYFISDSMGKIVESLEDSEKPYFSKSLFILFMFVTFLFFTIWCKFFYGYWFLPLLYFIVFWASMASLLYRVMKWWSSFF